MYVFFSFFSQKKCSSLFIHTFIYLMKSHCRCLDEHDACMFNAWHVCPHRKWREVTNLLPNLGNMLCRLCVESEN